MRTLTTEEMQEVSGGTCDCHCPPEKKPKGNNGWGNGEEGTNSGSLSGGTAGSKWDETWTTGDGPRPSKFHHR